MDQENKINNLEKKINSLEKKILDLELIISSNSIKNFDNFDNFNINDEVNLDNEIVNRSIDLFTSPPLVSRQHAFSNQINATSTSSSLNNDL